MFALGQLVDPDLSLNAGPVDVPLELQIPKLHVVAPVVGVGLTLKNLMDSPKGPIGDTVWHTAFWFRGGGIPGEAGTATIAGHVNDPLGRPEIFANLKDLHPGDLIILRYLDISYNIHFIVKEMRVYSLKESADPAVLARIFGTGPVAGTGPQPAPDGLSHLTLLTCAGDIVNGRFDHPRSFSPRAASEKPIRSEKGRYASPDLPFPPNCELTFLARKVQPTNDLP